MNRRSWFASVVGGIVAICLPWRASRNRAALVVADAPKMLLGACHVSQKYGSDLDSGVLRDRPKRTIEAAIGATCKGGQLQILDGSYSNVRIADRSVYAEDGVEFHRCGIPGGVYCLGLVTFSR